MQACNRRATPSLRRMSVKHLNSSKVEFGILLGPENGVSVREIELFAVFVIQEKVRCSGLSAAANLVTICSIGTQCP